MRPKRPSSKLRLGATTNWSAMASVHEIGSGSGCAKCLHPRDGWSDVPIPTIAFVSFWSGLLTATYYLHRAGERLPVNGQHAYLTPIRAENPFWGAVPVRSNCSTCGIAAGKGPRWSAA